MFEDNIVLSVLGGGAIGILYSLIFLRQHATYQSKNIFVSIVLSLLRLGFLGVSMIFLVAYAQASLVVMALSFIVAFWVHILSYARNNA